MHENKLLILLKNKIHATADKPAASNEVKPEAEADVSKVIEANFRVSPTALQSVSDMNSAEVGAAGEVVVDAAEVTFNATVVKDNFKKEARVHAVYQLPSDMDSTAGKAVVDATAIAAEADGAKLAASTVHTEAKLKAEADAPKAIEAHSVADKAIATAKANAALEATYECYRRCPWS